ncbi:uncharacterized protein TA15490 [Theileria annulata]|uniref:Transmembrane protein n=1 Tax=Theileria annulata TaxID=5874 RepID=Q4UFI8_THEAN|nr:uncharacterized protein TA15490 [Theileria annulata]CAI74128.1 hypothetical protein TA15490 [Theileria annulata]|eukprot:XP_951860.1 hypothetical protein TA15490 [Theileria annulata]
MLISKEPIMLNLTSQAISISLAVAVITVNSNQLLFLLVWVPTPSLIVLVIIKILQEVQTPMLFTPISNALTVVCILSRILSQLNLLIIVVMAFVYNSSSISDMFRGYIHILFALYRLCN